MPDQSPYLRIIEEQNLTTDANCGKMIHSVNVTLSDSVRHLLVERRRALILELDAIEQVLGYAPTICQLRRLYKDENSRK